MYKWVFSERLKLVTYKPSKLGYVQFISPVGRTTEYKNTE